MCIRDRQTDDMRLANKRGYTPKLGPMLGGAKRNKGGLRTADLRKGDLGFDTMQTFGKNAPVQKIGKVKPVQLGKSWGSI